MTLEPDFERMSATEFRLSDPVEEVSLRFGPEGQPPELLLTLQSGVHLQIPVAADLLIHLREPLTQLSPPV